MFYAGDQDEDEEEEMNPFGVSNLQSEKKVTTKYQVEKENRFQGEPDQRENV